MQVSSINNFNVCLPRKAVLNAAPQNQNLAPEVAFTGKDDSHNNKMMKAMRDTGVALMFLVPAASMTTGLTSCEKETETWGYTNVTFKTWSQFVDSTSCTHSPGVLERWFYNYKRPLPLDTLFNNFQNWDIDGTDGDKNDSTANRNIVHYEGVRDWEYGTKEIGDMNFTDANDPKILIYDIEIQDYKGNHEAYGKRVFRIPTGNYSITKADGTVLNSPGGLFVEEYENENDQKNGSILDCTLKSRAFVSTNGDTLNVSKRKGTNDYVETGKVAKGYLGANSILLRNLIGMYPTDDHYIDFKIDAVDDQRLRAMYVYAMDKKED